LIIVDDLVYLLVMIVVMDVRLLMIETWLG